MSQDLNKLQLLKNDFVNHLQKNNNHDVVVKLNFLFQTVDELQLNRIVCAYNQLKSSFTFYKDEYRTEVNYIYLIGHYIHAYMQKKLENTYIDKLLFILELCSTDSQNLMASKSFNFGLTELDNLIAYVESSELVNKLVILSMTEQLVETINIDKNLLNQLVEK